MLGGRGIRRRARRVRRSGPDSYLGLRRRIKLIRREFLDFWQSSPILLWVAAGLFFYMARVGVVGDDVDLREFSRVPRLVIRLLVLGCGVFFAIVPILAFTGALSWTELTGGAG